MKILVFTRYPEPGRVKTRLIPAVGKEGACNLHREMAEHSVKRLNRFRGIMEICFDGGDEHIMKNWLGRDLSYRPQGFGDLGERMERAFADVLLSGERKVVAVGTDCPSLSAGHIHQALCRLDESDLVLGPAADGGYYLIGMSKLYSKLFKEIDWGSDKVLLQTLVAAQKLGLRATLLEELADVDRPQDLPVWEKERKRLSKCTIQVLTLCYASNVLFSAFCPHIGFTNLFPNNHG
ncbi:MAG: TIGR04282 family arsenosugar biosynthesis glycosyltransferase [Dethiobacter sp.]|jgi:rSAM/selenodomain-associated transferase 1|nr:TIGR04282 family arsenosugar biosynthesis glycosyltransferase [Dethiobacter sp.]